MPLILCIETATAACSVALGRDGCPAGQRLSLEKNAHSKILNILIDELLQEANLKYSDLSAVAVSKGPGSYTGLRIGVSTAKGLCYALDIPLIAPDTLHCMAAGMIVSDFGLPDNALFCPMIDARRMEVFTAVYDKSLNIVIPVNATIVNHNAFADLDPERPVYYFGDGAEKCIPVLSAKPNWQFVQGFVNAASHMIPFAETCFHISHFEDVVYFEPWYLKDFIAGKPNVKGLR